MTEHREQAESLDDEVQDMQERSEQLGEQIASAREDWEEMRRDESVPGAPAPESGLPPEANYTTSGDQPPQDSDEREPWPDE